MSGPRVSSGTDSRQDFGTPAEYLRAVEKRFGPIVFDLAAHAGNHKHERYFAPAVLTATITKGETMPGVVVDDLYRQGADAKEVAEAIARIDWSRVPMKKGKQAIEISVRNHDHLAAAFDSLSQRWTTPGLQFLNPEFSDIGPWAAKCAAEATAVARVGFLVPSSTGSNWFAEHVAPHALTCMLRDRISFDGKNPYPKDLIFAVFSGGPSGICLWDWKNDVIERAWRLTDAVEVNRAA